MKRYTAEELRGDLYYTLPDDAVFYSRTDLIAAGVLVPARKGENPFCNCLVPIQEFDPVQASEVTSEDHLLAMLASEVADNVRLRSRYTGDVEGNLLQEICGLNNRIAGSIRIAPEGAPVKMADIYNWRCVDDVLGLYLWEGTLLQYTCTVDYEPDTAQPVRLVAASINTETSTNA